MNDSSASDSSASGNSTSHHSTDGYEQAGTVRPEAPRPGSLAALTGSVHLIMPASAWLGQTDAPGEVTGHGSLDADTCRDLAERLAASPGTRWCVTLTTPDGRAAAHACSRHGPSPPITPTPPGAPGSTSPSPAASSPSAPSSTTSHPANRPPPATGTLRTGQAAAGPWPPPATDTLRTGQMAAGPWPPPATDAIPIAGLADWLAGLKMAWLESGTCGHARQTAGYRPSPLLAHLITIRQRTCSFPGCRRPAWRCDQDHTIPHDQGGRTCECNLSALCRQHHRTKQAPDWHLTQPQPGVLTWTPPHGRTYTVIPQPYLT